MAGSRRGAVHRRWAWLARVAAACAALGATPAAALEEVGSNGIFLGDNGRMHPYAHLDLHYVTNPGRLFGAAVANDFLTVGRLGVDGSLKHTAWDLNFAINAAYNKYWGASVACTRSLSAALGSGHVDADINKGGAFELRLSNDLVRSADIANQSFTRRLLHWMETFNATGEYTPGGGALILTLGYGYFYDWYDHTTFFKDGTLDNGRHLPRLRLSWKFLPKTAVFIEGEAQITHFNSIPYAGTTATNIDGRMLQVTAGLTGNVTKKVTTLFKAGYGNTLEVKGTDNLQTVVGQLEIAYAPMETCKLAAGVQRSLQPTSFFRYFVLDKAYLRYEQQIADHTQVGFSPEYSVMDFGTPVVPGIQSPGQPNRDDHDLVMNITLTQAFSEWLSVSLMDKLDYRTSNFNTANGNAGYFFNDVWLRFDLRY
jgi:hypothetical protein